jgi:hypothetical protein
MQPFIRSYYQFRVMATFYKPIITRLILIAFVILYGLPAHAQLSANSYKKLKLSDSSGKYLSNNYNATPTAANTISSGNSSFYENDAATLEKLAAGLKKPQERRKLLAYLKTLNADNDLHYNKSGAKFYYHLANTFARLRFYPLAMKCFFKTIQYQQENDSLQQAYTANDADSTKANAGYLVINSNDDSVLNKKSFSLENLTAAQKKSRAINYEHITNTFKDGKKAVAYAVLFHVKQPVPGKRKIFAVTNTGHTFITLIKYNADSTYISLSFGFYPHKDNILSATPLEPATSSVFKDDSGHKWDEVLGKFISKRRFEKILALTGRYSQMEYHLSKNNCTDFSLDAAIMAGINISDTSGKWPLGSGNNPAITGQSILQGKFSDADNGRITDLFIDWDPSIQK